MFSNYWDWLIGPAMYGKLVVSALVLLLALVVVLGAVKVSAALFVQFWKGLTGQ